MPVIKSSDYGARDSFICLFFFSNPQDILGKKSSFKEQLYLLKRKSQAFSTINMAPVIFSSLIIIGIKCDLTCMYF